MPARSRAARPRPGQRSAAVTDLADEPDLPEPPEPPEDWDWDGQDTLL